MKKVLNYGKNIWIRCVALSMLVLSIVVACEPEEYPLATTDEVNMTGYFEQETKTARTSMLTTAHLIQIFFPWLKTFFINKYFGIKVIS